MQQGDLRQEVSHYWQCSFQEFLMKLAFKNVSSRIKIEIFLWNIIWQWAEWSLPMEVREECSPEDRKNR